MEIDISSQQVPEGMAVHIEVRLTGRETSRLFVSGDTLVHLPLDGALPNPEGAPVPRTSIFLSELAGSRDGLSRTFVDVAAAEHFASCVRGQLETSLEG